MQRSSLFQDDENTRGAFANQGFQYYTEAYKYLSTQATQPQIHPIFFLQSAMFYINQAIQCYERANQGSSLSPYDQNLQMCYSMRASIIESYGNFHYLLALNNTNNLFQAIRYINVAKECYDRIELPQGHHRVVELSQLVAQLREKYKEDLQAATRLAMLEDILQGKVQHKPSI